MAHASSKLEAIRTRLADPESGYVTLRQDVGWLIGEVDRLNAAVNAHRNGLGHAENEVALLERRLADCYRATGEDPDGNENWRLAEHALPAVERLAAELERCEQSRDRLRQAIADHRDAYVLDPHGYPEHWDRTLHETLDSEPA